MDLNSTLSNLSQLFPSTPPVIPDQQSLVLERWSVGVLVLSCYQLLSIESIECYVSEFWSVGIGTCLPLFESAVQQCSSVAVYRTVQDLEPPSALERDTTGNVGGGRNVNNI